MEYLEYLKGIRPAEPAKLDFKIDNDPFPYSDFESDSEECSEPDDHAELEWLNEQIAHIAPTVGLENPQMFSLISEQIKSSRGADQLTASLVDVVGFDHLDFLTELSARLEPLKAQLEDKLGLDEQKRAGIIRKNQASTHERNQNLQPAKVDPKYPHVYRKPGTGGTVLSAMGTKFALPAGSERISLASEERVFIPAPTVDTSYHPKRLLKIKELDDICQKTFAKYDTLNKMQSLVYDIGYNTNENMLICAPTGAGKTDVALITMLNTIKRFRENGKVRLDDFKIVYVAPLKALAAEITEKMASRLKWLGVSVRELTGDMQLTRQEINATQVIVTTPEKWDVVTRKPNDDNGLAARIKLLIIDEVHLLHEERGAVLESLVARTQRQVEATQSLIRIVGLSATLPNFIDVAEFLKVNPQQGLFYFDQSFRPCPLEQLFIAPRNTKTQPVTATPADEAGASAGAGQGEEKPQKRITEDASAKIDAAAFEQCVKHLRMGQQVMIFVHSRADTLKTARTFRKLAQEEGLLSLFKSDKDSGISREMAQHKNRDMKEVYEAGFAVHHAGMLRSERNLSEKMFLSGAVNVLCCTATLAWGVNLPAAVVIIKGTQVYNPQKGGFVDLGISDVIQIFGRAGRPQFEKFGTGILVTTPDRLDHYVSLITNQFPIESRMGARLADNLNAEIALGTVTNLSEAVSWLGYTYLYVRMRKAPQTYGLLYKEVQEDPHLVGIRRKLIVAAAQRLMEVQMIVFDEDNSEAFIPKDIGRIASEFYLLNSSIEVFNKALTSSSSEETIFATLGLSGEFDSIRSRKDEQDELKSLQKQAHFKIKQGIDSSEGKTNALLQAYISQINIKTGALGSDTFYIAQNAVRIVRALFLLCVSRRWGQVSQTMLDLDKSINKRIWPDSHPLLQFDMPNPIKRQLEAKNLAIEDMKVMSANELGDLVHNQGMGPRLATMVAKFPLVTIMDAQVRPITSRVMRIELELMGNFRWDHFMHGKAQYFWIWVQEDTNDSEIIHSERLILYPQSSNKSHNFDFAIPIKDPAPDQLIVRVVSDTWLGSEAIAPLSFKHLIPPEARPIKTQLLNLRPLPVGALHNPKVEAYYSKKFQFFNPMQTMVFHSLYNAKTPVLLGSPTGSGKTIACELAIWAALRDQPEGKIVYIAPMKALVKERVHDWNKGLCKVGGLKLVELTGDTNPDPESIRSANIIITTPEKFDGISRSWQTRKFVQQVSLIIMDEIHLLASDRGAILEMIVSRMNFVRKSVGHDVRLMGMSTAVANAGDMASWLGVSSNAGLFNFPSSVRPVPLEMYIDGFPEMTGFCPFMKSMNKPAFLAIKRHSPTKPALVFVPSRRQTRLTAQDFIHMCGNEDNPRRFLHMTEAELEFYTEQIQDDTLRLSIQFGIAVHHAGLVDSDRKVAHELFAQSKVQILIATSTLAWGVNLPAYLVVVKGTQFYDKKIEKYRDMDLTDVLQMMGRAGRPGFDTSGVACVFTKQSTKAFYKYFLNIGFPVESSLHKFMEDHIGAEISSGTIATRQGILDFLTWTFLYRRIHANPSYYGVDEKNVNQWLVERVDKCLGELGASQCIVKSLGDGGVETIAPTTYLKISSFYYLSHKTMRGFLAQLKDDMQPVDALKCLALATEYDELAIRHNEDLLNEELSKNVPYHGDQLGLRMVDPHVKAFLLVQAKMQRVGLPIEDYIQDTITVLDNAIRILQAMLDTAASLGYFSSCVTIVHTLRCIKQGCDTSDNMLRVLPGLWKTKSQKPIAKVGASDAKKLHVPAEFLDDFRLALKAIPRPKFESEGDELVLAVRKKPVWCGHYHKPQVESWVVVHEIDGVVQSLERVQRRTTILRPHKGSIHVMNDTIANDFVLTAAP